MRRLRRNLILAAAVLLAVGAIGVALWLLKKAPPRAVRLLPEVEDAVLYVNLKPMRLAGMIGKQKAGLREAEYEQFVRETGFEFERDLDQAAFAMHAPSPQTQGQRRFSEIFIGRFDSGKLAAYLRKLGGPVSPESHRGLEIFLIPHEGRTVRVAILGVDTVAVSNLEGGEAMREMIGHSRAAALPRHGPALVRQYYREVPFGSLGWAIAKVSAGEGATVGGFDVGATLRNLMGGAVVVGSLRYLPTDIRFRAEAFAPEAQARQIGDNLTALLAMYRTVEGNVQPGGPDPDVKALFDSIRIETRSDRAVLTAEVPPGFIHKLLTEPPPEVAAPAVEPKKEVPKKPRRKRK